MDTHFTITGIVEHGQGQGDKTGAKTANLPLSLATFPQGLYFATVDFEDSTYRALLYFGINSLTDQDCLEVHLLDYSGDLYGKSITVTTGRFLRPPMKFANVEELRAQIEKDLAEVEANVSV